MTDSVGTKVDDCPSKRERFIIVSISHARGVHGLLLLLFEVADAGDGGMGIVRIRHPDSHGVVLVGY